MPRRVVQRDHVAQPSGKPSTVIPVRAALLAGWSGDAARVALPRIGSPEGLAWSNSGGSQPIVQNVTSSADSRLIVGVFMVRDNSTNNVITTWGNVSDGQRIQIDVSGGQLRAIAVGSNVVGISASIATGRWYRFAFQNSSTRRALALNGRIVGTDTQVFSNSAYDRVGVLCGANSSYPSGVQPIDGAAALLAYADATLSDGALAALSDNPWQQLFDAQRVSRAVAGAGSAPMTGTAIATAAASGALSTSIRLTGMASAVAAAVGGLTTSLPLSGAAVSVASASGVLSTGVRLAGSASAVAAASGSLSTAVRLTGSAAGLSTAAGQITTAIPLAGSAVATAAGAGTLSTSISLAGAAVAVATAAADLAGSSASLTGAAVASAAGAGQLSTSIRLTGAAIAQATASANLAAPGSSMAGAAVASATAAGALSTAIRLAGSAASQATGSAGLLTGIRLTGSAQAQATAAGALTVTPAGLSGAASVSASAAASLTTLIRLQGLAAVVASAAGNLTAGGLSVPNSRRRPVARRDGGKAVSARLRRITIASGPP